MSDPLGAALGAAAAGTLLAYPLVFVAGVATSVGPCIVPRYVAVAALAHASRRPWRIAGAFAAGLIGAYVLLGLAVTSMNALWSSSRWWYGALAVALAASGLATLLRREAVHECGDRHHRTQAHASLGGTFLLGASSALIVSPCCTPAITAIAGLTTLSGRVAEGVLFVATFACGHALPLAVAAAAGTRLASVFSRLRASQASATVAGALMLALAGYYAVLA